MGKRRRKKNQSPRLCCDNPARKIITDHRQIPSMQGELNITVVILFLNRDPYVECAAQPSQVNMGCNITTTQHFNIPAIKGVFCRPIPKYLILTIIVLLQKLSDIAPGYLLEGHRKKVLSANKLPMDLNPNEM